MGLDFGFSKAKKYKDTTASELHTIQTYLDWLHWNKDRYTLENYLNNFADGDPLPSQDKIDFYANIYDNNSDIYKNVDNLCGWDSSFIQERVAGILNRINNNLYDGINEETLKEMYCFVDEELDRNKLIPVYVKKGIRKTKSGDELMFPLSGLIVEDEDEKQTVFRLSEYTRIYVPSDEFDEWKNSALKHFRRALDAVSEIDQDEYIVWFYVSY